MEYINGLILADYMKIIELSNISNIAKIFLSIIPDNIIYDENAKSIFITKIKTLSETIINKSEIIDISLQKLENYEWKYVQLSACHGDLTLENIIMSNNDLYIIDFLDGFYDSWQIDIAKILQDIEMFWHYRNEKTDTNLFLRLLVLKKIILSELLAFKDGKKIVETIYHILLLNIVRILPYTKDEHTYDFLQNCLVLLNNKINTSGWEKYI
jgi:hypothetical protein